MLESINIGPLNQGHPGWIKPAANAALMRTARSCAVQGHDWSRLLHLRDGWVQWLYMPGHGRTN